MNQTKKLRKDLSLSKALWEEMKKKRKFKPLAAGGGHLIPLPKCDPFVLTARRRVNQPRKFKSHPFVYNGANAGRGY